MRSARSSIIAVFVLVFGSGCAESATVRRHGTLKAADGLDFAGCNVRRSIRASAGLAITTSQLPRDCPV
jgi:hypothetical protein